MGLLFEGLKVLDCGSFIAAPAAATILSDFGADVVKIEPPEGDHMRLRAPLRDGSSAHFGQLTRLTGSTSPRRCSQLD